MWYNPIIKFILNSPFHGLVSRGILLLTYIGCRSGTEYSIPLSYVRENDDFLILALSRRTWWRNFRGSAPITIRVKGKTLNARALAITEPADAVQAALNIYLKSQKDLARVLKVHYDTDGLPDQEALAKAAEGRVMVRIQLDNQ